MFTLTKHAAKVTHLNVREEKHGEEEVLALDIKINADIGNDFLDQLSPGLKAAFYAQDSTAMDLGDTHLPVIKFPKLPSLDWDGEMKADLVLHGERKADNLEFTADINKLVLNLKEGGTVNMTFRAQCLPDPVEVGKISELLGQMVKCSVTPSHQPPLDPPLE